MEVREKILDATIEVFNKKGLKFTMDDVAAEVSMSKKTIYTVFKDKESMFYEMVDYCFDHIKEAEQTVLEDDSLSTLEKIRKLLSVMPDSYRDVDFGQLYSLKEKYPKIYEKVELRLETGWEASIALIEQGINEGVVRPVNPVIVKTMLEATLEQFLRRNILGMNQMRYTDALEQAVDVILDGIRA